MTTKLSDLLCTKYCEPITVTSAAADPIPGQLIWVHAVYPPSEKWIIRVDHYDATDPARSRYRAKKYEDGDRSHFPIAELQLGSDENYYIYVGKERPAIVLGGVASTWANELKAQNLFLCAPLFTFKHRHTDLFRMRAAAFDFPSFFYMPAEPGGCSQEGVVRFELIQPISRRGIRNFLADTHPVALTNEGYALFVNHLLRFTMKKDFDPAVCEQMDTYRELVLEEIAKQKKEPSSK